MVDCSGNLIWQGNVFPSEWEKAIIVPIPKPGKDHTRPENYRPIALTSTLCKLMEKILNKRLRWYIETNDLLSKFQSGFRQRRSTMDHLVNVETSITDALVNKQHAIVVSMDIERAFEMVWRRRVITIAVSWGINGHLLEFIKNFLRKRLIQVRVNNILSKVTVIKNGVPQGCVLSVTLFLIAIDEILSNVTN